MVAGVGLLGVNGISAVLFRRLLARLKRPAEVGCKNRPQKVVQ